MMRSWSGARSYLVMLLSAIWIRRGVGTVGPTESITTPNASESNGSHPIEKHIVSSRLRLVIFAGLEGTGHHYVSDAFSKMYNTPSDVVEIDACEIARNIYLPLTMATDPSHYQDTQAALRSALQNLAEREQDLGGEGTIVTVQHRKAQPTTCRGANAQLSFPNKSGPEKALAYPDLQVLARVAEEERIDLRILFLQRSAKELLLSDVVHRHFHRHLKGHHVRDDSPDEAKFMEYMRVILTAASVLHSALAELGCGFVICHSYDLLGDEEQAGRIARFLAPSDTVAEYLSSALLGTAEMRESRNESLGYTNAQAVADRLQSKLDVMELQFCDQRCR